MKKMMIIVIVAAVAGCCGNVGEAVLDVVDVDAPAINCVFDSDCTITVADTSDELVLVGMVGSGFLRSRTLPVGEPGTLAEGLYGYEYRIDLRDNVGVLDIACAVSFSIDFGPVTALDYDGDGNLDDAYVVTGGGLGTVALSSVLISGNRVTFSFSSGVCAGSSAGNGDSSFFFGLASTSAPGDVTASVGDNNGVEYSLEARAPNFCP